MNEDRAADHTHPEAPLTAAVDRLRAARGTRDDDGAPAGASTATAGAVGPAADLAPWDRPVRGGAAENPLVASAKLADELRRRLEDRRDAAASAKHAAAAYAALHGHVPGGSDDELGQVGHPRWALRPRTALVAVCAVLMLVTAGGVLTLWPRGDAEDLAVVASGLASQPSELDEESRSAGSGTGAGVGTGVVAGAGADPGATSGAAPAPSTLLVVDVVGQVNQPGVVTLPDGSRVFDAVAAAGGATEQAELSGLNMARIVVDGEQIRVPAPGEVVPAPAAAPNPPAADDGGLVNLNSADETQLDTLPGIGPALAARIIAWRGENGPFATVDELDEVSGIGPAMLATLRDLVTV